MCIPTSDSPVTKKLQTSNTIKRRLQNTYQTNNELTATRFEGGDAPGAKQQYTRTLSPMSVPRSHMEG
jgi:hypothetical protein